MEQDNRTTPSLSPREAEEFWTGGLDARRSAPGDPGTLKTSIPCPAAWLDARVLRAIRADHENADPHHANLCPICLILAAALGEPMPEGRWIEPAERAIVYGRTLHLLGRVSGELLGDVIRAAMVARGLEIESGAWRAAQWAPVHLLGLAGLPAGSREETLNGRAYAEICAAVRAGEAAYPFISPVEVSPGTAPPVRSGRPYAASEVLLELLRNFGGGGEFEQLNRREGLLSELVFAARDLAEGRLAGDGCCECHATGVEHMANCRAGRVLRTLGELVANEPVREAAQVKGGAQ